MPTMLSLLYTLAWAVPILAAEVGVIEFENIGFMGDYYAIDSIEIANGNCSCSFGRGQNGIINNNGPNGPYNEELAVQIAGPINLRKFAFYTSSAYESGSSDGNWTRGAYYDSEAGTADNVTFLANVGNENCLGRALTYVSANGTAPAPNATVLHNVTLDSNTSVLLYSGKQCAGDSSVGGECLVYRPDIEAYHGFDGEVKAFFFEFTAPIEESTAADTVGDTSITLYNARIPRTTYGNCNGSDTWDDDMVRAGGEFAVFDAYDPTNTSMLFSGLYKDSVMSWSTDYLLRTPESLMRGGVVFGSDGSATVFLSNSTSFNETFETSDLHNWIHSVNSQEGTEEVPMSTTTSASSNPAGELSIPSFVGLWGVLYTLLLSLL